MNGLELLVLILATKRITRLVTEDEITRSLRLAAADKGALEYLVGCTSCVSVWAGAASLVLPRRVRYLLASSEAAIMLAQSFKLAERLAL
jgi:hypothetical protein